MSCVRSEIDRQKNISFSRPRGSNSLDAVRALHGRDSDECTYCYLLLRLLLSSRVYRAQPSTDRRLSIAGRLESWIDFFTTTIISFSPEFFTRRYDKRCLMYTHTLTHTQNRVLTPPDRVNKQTGASVLGPPPIGSRCAGVYTAASSCKRCLKKNDGF